MHNLYRCSGFDATATASQSQSHGHGLSASHSPPHHSAWTVPHQPHLSIHTAAPTMAMPMTLPTATAASIPHLATSSHPPPPIVPASAPAHITTFAAAQSSVRAADDAPPPASGRSGEGVKTIMVAGARERKRHNSWAGTAPNGPGSSANVQVSRCDQPGCTKVYAGPNAVSNLKRHKCNVHHIPLSAQPRHTRWDHTLNRPRDEQERRERMLEAKRKYARKARARQKAARHAAQAGLRPQGLVPGPMQALGPAPAPFLPLLSSHAPRQVQAPYPGLVFYTQQTAQVPLPPSQAPLSMPRSHSVPTTHVSLPPVADEPELFQPLGEEEGSALGLLSEPLAPFPSFEALSLGGLAGTNTLYMPPSANTNGAAPVFPHSGTQSLFSFLQDTPAFAPQNGFPPSASQSSLSLSDASLMPMSMAPDESDVGMSSADTHLTVPSARASPPLGTVPLLAKPQAEQLDAGARKPEDTQAEDAEAWTCSMLHSPSAQGTSLSPWKTWLGPRPDASPAQPSGARPGEERLQSC